MKKREKATTQQLKAGLSRRRALGLAGIAAATAPFASLVGGSSQAKADDRDGRHGWHGRHETHGWARGGTAAIKSRLYPDPFEFAERLTCMPTCGLMLGPCHDDLAPERKDISEGLPGLPMRLGFRIVDDACSPVTDASVDIWHCNAEGSYSSETSDVPSFCTDGAPDTLASRFFRGHQKTDERGIVWFNSCMPGWYTGRAVHIHATIRRPGREGEEFLTTQVAFSTNLITEVFSCHPDYVAHGLPDTPNDGDLLFEVEYLDQLTLNTQRMFDGVLLAWTTIAIRSATDAPYCFSGPTEEELGPLPI